MRIPVAVNLESRDGGVTKDAKTVNGIVEVKGEGDGAVTVLRKRPGVQDLGSVKSGTAQCLTVWNGVKAIIGDYMNFGAISTITSSPTQTNLSPTNAGLMFSAQATNSDAATPRLMFKNRSQAWYMNRAGTISSITYGGSMGSNTYTILSLTRVSTTATATIAEDVFNIGDSVTIAGASDANYNGTKTITAVTAGSTTPSTDIPITITRSGTTATATTVSGSAHGLTSGSSYTISGANQSAYNGSESITTSGGSTFTYTVTVTPDSARTWNPADKDADVSLSGGNLVATSSSGANASVRATNGKSSGKWYWEVTLSGYAFADIGVSQATDSITDVAIGSMTNGYGYRSDGVKSHAGTAASYGATFAIGDVVGVALDMDSGTITFYKNGVSQGQAYSSLSGTYYPTATVGAGTAAVVTANFGATAFSYSVPSGYYAWQSDDPISPATGAIIVTKPGSAINPTFSYTVAGSPATPDGGASKTAQGAGGTVPGIAYINGYFCVMDSNGVIWNSNSDDPSTWGGTAFLTAQYENGSGRAIAKSQNYLIAFKEWSTEFFYDAANASGSPFSPVDNGFTLVGCANGYSVAPVHGSLFWIAQTKEEGRSVYMMTGLEQVKVSTADVDRILNADDLATVYAYGLELDGHPLYLVTLVTSNITLVFDLVSKTWGQWSSYTLGSSKSVTSITRSGTTATVVTSTAHTISDGDPVLMAGADQTEYNGVFQASYISTTSFSIEVAGSPTSPATGTITAKPYTESYFKFSQAANYSGRHLLLHESDGHLYQLSSSVYQDAGLPINLFARTTRLDGGSFALKRMSSIDVVANNSTDIVMVRWSDDDSSTFSAYRVVRLSDDVPRARKCGAFRRRSLELRHVGNSSPQIEAYELEIK